MSRFRSVKDSPRAGLSICDRKTERSRDLTRINGEASLLMLDEFGDIVQGKPRFEITEIAGSHLEGRPRDRGAAAFQPPRSVSLTISRKDRPARCASLLSVAATSSLRVNVVRMVLRLKHHDVKPDDAIRGVTFWSPTLRSGRKPPLPTQAVPKLARSICA